MHSQVTSGPGHPRPLWPPFEPTERACCLRLASLSLPGSSIPYTSVEPAPELPVGWRRCARCQRRPESDHLALEPRVGTQLFRPWPTVGAMEEAPGRADAVSALRQWRLPASLRFPGAWLLCADAAYG